VIDRRADEPPLDQPTPKQVVSDLALFGGQPAFSEPLHVGRPNIGDRAMLHARIDAALDRRWLTNNGPLSEELEERIEAELGVSDAITVTNATVGLQIVARAAGLQGQIIVPSFSFIATAHAFEWIGLEPVFAEIEPERLTLDPAAVEPLIGPRTSAIVATHLWGRSADVEALASIAEAHDLTLLFDAAHAYGCARDGRMIGGFGQAEVFSFHATKFVNAFEGGVITTDDEDFAERCRLLRNFGFDHWDHTESGGTNGKMHEGSAAMGLTSLDAAADIVAVNHRNLHLYRDGLAGLQGIRLMPSDDRGKCNGQYVVLRIEPDQSPIHRDRLMALLNAENVLARRYFYPGCHLMSPYRDRPTVPSLPVTERVAAEALVLPTGTAAGPADIAAVCSLIRFGHAQAGQIAERDSSLAQRT
jgi:dTDP-4-amino-4,6-dideoxygalactose transaminase